MKRFLIVFVAVIIAMQCSFGIALAENDSAGYTTESFNVEVEIDENFVFHITEIINVDFTEEKHGIYRYITKENSAYLIENIRVKDHEYETYDEDTFYIQIGDPDVLVSGKQQYTISYDIVGLKDKDGKKDTVYLDVLPTGWETAIRSSNIVVNFPKTFDVNTFKVVTGIYGTNVKDDLVEYNFSDDGLMLTMTVNNLEQGQGVTIFAELPEGYWINPKSLDWLMYAIILLFAAGILGSAFYWYKYGRDKKVIRTVEFYPPDNMTPAEVGYVVKGSSTDEQISSMIIYFAEKNYLIIRENEKRQFQLIKNIKKLPEEEKIYARMLFNGIFKKSDEVYLNELPEGMDKIYEKAQLQLDKVFEKQGNALFTEKSKKAQIYFLMYHTAMGVVPCILTCLIGINAIGLGLSTILLLGGSALFGIGAFVDIYDNWNIGGLGTRVKDIILTIGALGVNYFLNFITYYENFHSILFCIAFVVLSLVFAGFITVMQSRTTASHKLLERTLGFRDFIETAELNKLRTLSTENPKYFYNIMPYAYVLGLSDQWIEHFMNQIPVSKPDWYSGNCTDNDDNFWYNHMVARCISSMNTNIDNAIYVDEDSAGSGGGGLFSGGGFGGGGGGSW